jgi:TPR repeat protein
MKHLLGMLATTVFASGALAAPAPWVEVKSPHFTVVTNSGEKAGRKVAWQFEQIRAATARVFPFARVDSTEPFVILAARDEVTLRALGPQFWEGKQFRPVSFAASAPDKQFAALRTDLREGTDLDENPYRSAYWSYVSVTFGRSFPVRLPAWLHRGVAELMSNTAVHDDELLVGRPVRRTIQTLREHGLVPMDEFLGADGRSPWLTGELQIYTFDAQSWAFVHYLLFGERGAHQPKFSQLATLLLEGIPAPKAVPEALGNVEALYLGMKDYIQRSLMSYSRLDVSVAVRAETFPTRPLTGAESATIRAEFLVATGRAKEARTLADEARKADPKAPGPDEIEGRLLEREDRRAEAQAAFETAVAAGSASAWVHYRLAQMLWQPPLSPEARAKIAGLLERAKELAPDDAKVLSYLADIRVDQERAADALALAERAVQLEPEVSYHRLAHARALWASKRGPEAAQAARSALNAARTADERQRAQSFLEFVQRQPARPASGAATSTPDALASPATEPTAEAEEARPSAATTTSEEDPYQLLARCYQKRENAACGKAVPFLESECQRQAAACASLGSILEGGLGTKADPIRAARAYEKGCAGGDKSACARFAVLQARGRGVLPDPVKAISTLQALCAEKVQHGCIGWAQLLAQEGETVKAKELLKGACDAGVQEGCRMLAGLP